MTSTKLLAVSCVGLYRNMRRCVGTTLPEGRVYDFDFERSRGACPAADWHIVVGANNTLSGVITWDNAQAMAHATGAVNANRTFQMTAVRVDEGGKGNTATIDGTVSVRPRTN